MDPVAVIATAVWSMLPAYVPNNAAVIAGGGAPIDGGRTYGGKRLLGDGKTWRGTVAGITAGAILGVALNTAVDPVGSVLRFALPTFPVAAVIGLPAGAMLGDIAGSFLKRRTGRDRGAPAPGLDQFDFVVGALGLTILAAPGWFLATFTLPVIVVVLVLTPALHVGTNVIGYLLGLKNEPW